VNPKLSGSEVRKRNRKGTVKKGTGKEEKRRIER